MRWAITKKLTRHSFLLSIIFHLFIFLFLLLMSTVITINPNENAKKPPQLYIPSYVYKGAITPATNNTPPSQQREAAENIQKVQTKPSILASQAKNVTDKNHFFPQKSILDMSRSMIQQNQVNTALNNLNHSETPILLVGDKHAIVDPLIKLVGRSLSAHFHYPRIEGTFGARGRVYIELVLHPEGYFSDVQIVQSSDFQDFDAAALYAVNTAPTVVGVDKFLPKPKRFIVGFIFE